MSMPQAFLLSIQRVASARRDGSVNFVACGKADKNRQGLADCSAHSSVPARSTRLVMGRSSVWRDRNDHEQSGHCV
jgi:hypothetical protein